MNNIEIVPLFPSALLKTNLNEYKITEDELAFINSIKKYSRYNFANYTSNNSKILDCSELLRVKNILLKYIDYYFENIVCSDKKVIPYITQSWINFTEKGGSHHRHHHCNSLISGVLYVAADSTHDRIHFHKQTNSQIEIFPTSYNIFNSSIWWVNVGSNDLILFPSEMQHSVDKHEQDYTRISISFNVFCNGIFGRIEDLNHLKL